MQIFVTGTDTNVGKTTVSQWLCHHLKYPYFKPVQTGPQEDRDTDRILEMIPGHSCLSELYHFPTPVSPHLAARLSNDVIKKSTLVKPQEDNLIIEGAGGLFVPLNDEMMMIDLIKLWEVPVVLVARSTLGTINHTLLSLMALRQQKIPILGVILNGPLNFENKIAISHYGDVDILAEIPSLEHPYEDHLKSIPMSEECYEKLSLF